MGQYIQEGRRNLFETVISVENSETDITINKDEDDRVMQSSKAQAVRTFSQTVGGTITGFSIRAICIYGLIAAFAKAGGKVGEKIAKSANSSTLKIGELINPNGKLNEYQLQESATAWAKIAGGTLSTITMLATNFIFDIPIINAMNSALSKKILGTDTTKPESVSQEPAKEVNHG